MVTSYQASSFQYGSSDPSGIFVVGKTRPCSTTVLAPAGAGSGAVSPHVASRVAAHAMLAQTMAPTETATEAAT